MVVGSNPRIGCVSPATTVATLCLTQQTVAAKQYWMHEVHISADVALYFRLNYYRSGRNESFLRDIAYPVVSATADFLASRSNRSSHPSNNWT